MMSQKKRVKGKLRNKVRQRNKKVIIQEMEIVEVGHCKARHRVAKEWKTR